MPWPRFFVKGFLPLCLLAVLAPLSMSACAESLALEEPGDDVLFYQPRSMANFDDSTVYLVNTNYDKRFSAGWISAIDVAQIVAAIDANTSGAAAVSRPLMVPRLGGRLVFNINNTKAFLPHAGSGILTVIDLNPGPNGTTLSCGDTGDRSNLPTDLANTSCDRFHLVDLIDQAWQQDTTRKQSDFSDPAAVVYVPANGTTPETLLVGYLGVSWLTTLSLTDAPDPTSARMAAANLSAPTIATSATSIRHLTPSVADPLTVYASGSASDGSTVFPLSLSGTQVTQGSGIDLAAPTGGSAVERSLVSPVDSSLIYTLNRQPDEVVTLKRTLRPVGLVNSADRAAGKADTVPSATLQLQAEVVGVDSSQPFDLVYASRSSAAGSSLSDIVAVVGVAKNTVYFLQPTPTGLRLVGRVPLESDRILTSPTPALEGGGPGGIAYINARAYGSTYTDLLFVSNYYSHTLSVIDISSQSAGAFKEVLRIEGNNLGPSLRYP